MSEAYELKDKNLRNLLKSFKKPPRLKVGILGKSNARTENGLTNAYIGAIHEYGTKKMPQRSFLRVPIQMKLDGALKKSKQFKPDDLKKVITEVSLEAWMKKIGVIAVSVILEGFATGGYGKWKPSNMKRKKVQQTLVESQQLRNSISFEVK